VTDLKVAIVDWNCRALSAINPIVDDVAFSNSGHSRIERYGNFDERPLCANSGHSVEVRFWTEKASPNCLKNRFNYVSPDAIFRKCPKSSVGAPGLNLGPAD
jgi:hypothetical protein